MSAVPDWLSRLFPVQDVESHVLGEVGEEVIFNQGHHWVAYLKAIGLAVLGILLLVVIFPFSTVEVGWFWLLVGFALLVTAWTMAALVHLDRFVLTTKRVLRVRGLLSKKRASMPLSRILDITVETPLAGQLFDYGHLIFESAAQVQGLREIRHIDRPDIVERIIQQQVLGPVPEDEDAELPPPP